MTYSRRTGANNWQERGRQHGTVEALLRAGLTMHPTPAGPYWTVDGKPESTQYTTEEAKAKFLGSDQ